jgi:tetratricopeptide (TPR) repeat protein
VSALWSASALAALGASVIVGPLLLGGAFPWATVVVATLAATATAFAARGPWAEPEPVPPLLWLAVCLLAWTILQALPLPVAIVDFLTPASAEDARRALAAVGLAAPGWVPLSRAPGDTWTEAVKGVAICGCMTVGYVLAGRGHRDTTLRLVGTSATVCAVIAVGHAATSATSVFGVYEPAHGSRHVLGPLINPNHLAGVCALGATLACGLAVDPPMPKERPVWTLATVLCAGANALTGSRGGFLALVGGLGTVLAWATMGRRGQRRTPGPLAWSAAFVAVASLTIAATLAADALLPRFTDGTATEKIVFAWRVTDALPTTWTVGVGRGAIGEVVTQVAGTGSSARATHLEVAPLQWAVEWGAIPAATLLAIGSLAWFQALRRAQSTRRAAALFAVGALGAQNLVDFSLEMTGVAVVAATALGAAVGQPRTESSRVGTVRLPLAGFVRACAVGAALVVALAGPFVQAWSSETLVTRARRALADGRTEAVRSSVVTGARMQPAEPALPLLGAAAAARTRDPATGPLLNRAMELAPEWAAPHLLAADVLRAAGRAGQAWLEVRQAASRSPGEAAAWVCRLLRAGGQAESIEASVPSDPAAAVAFLQTAARCADPRSEASRTIDSLLTERGADARGRRLRAMRRALAANRPDDAIAAMRTVSERDRTVEEVSLLAEALLRSGAAAEALELADVAVARWPGDRTLHERRARIATALGRADLMRSAVDALRDLSAGDPRRLAGTLRLHAQLEASLGNHARAVTALEQAQRISDDPETLRLLARTAERAGQRRRAAQIWHRLCGDEGPSSAACAESERLNALERPPGMPQPIPPPLPGFSGPAACAP